MGICCMTQGTQTFSNNLEGWDGEGGGKEFREGGESAVPMADSC